MSTASPDLRSSAYAVLDMRLGDGNGLDLVIDEAEGYAYLRSATEDPDNPLPRLVPRHRLSFPVSLLLAVLRKALAEFDAGAGEGRLVVSRDRLVDELRTFRPATTNDAKLVDEVDRSIRKVVELGFLRPLPGPTHRHLRHCRHGNRHRRRRCLMTDALFSTLEVDLGAGVRPGYRLHRLELLNWGTFDGRCEVLRLAGDNTLVTGDIGSGKSTLVDAVTTLLLPANRISYNKAAGAETRERSLRTYVLGHYKSERVESTGASRAVGLRDQSSYSVILGVFRNEGYGQDVTLAQVFWMPGTSESQPRRFFVTAEDDLSIAADFTEFGTDPADLKRRLRSRGASVHDHYPDYGTRAGCCRHPHQRPRPALRGPDAGPRRRAQGS